VPILSGSKRVLRGFVFIPSALWGNGEVHRLFEANIKRPEQCGI